MPLIVAAPMKGHLVHVLSPIVELIQIAEPRLSIEILEIALPSHISQTPQSPFLFPFPVGARSEPPVSAIFEA